MAKDIKTYNFTLKHIKTTLVTLNQIASLFLILGTLELFDIIINYNIHYHHHRCVGVFFYKMTII